MRIVSRAEFLKMPSGTIFRDAGNKYKSYHSPDYGEICIKGSTENDDYQEMLLGYPMEYDEDDKPLGELKQGVSVPMKTDMYGRSGTYGEEECTYLVFEKHDLWELSTIVLDAYDKETTCKKTQ